MINTTLLTNAELLHEVDEAVRRERNALPYLLACLAEVERRGLHLDCGHRDMFDYCVVRLKYAPGAAIRRIYSARAGAKFPEIYSMLREGELSLGVVSLIAPHLNSQNASSVLSRASGKSKREIEELVSELSAARDAAAARVELEAPPQSEFSFEGGASIAQTPHADDVSAEAAVGAQVPSLARDTIRVRSPGVLRIAFSASPGFREKLERVQGLIGRFANRRIELVLEAVMEDFLDRRDPARRKEARPRRGSLRRTRRVPRWVKDAVWKRDAAQCAFMSGDGRRCSARDSLEFDHVRPWALGGASNDPDNIRLLCRAHNMRLARRVFGDRVPASRAA